MAEIQRSIFLSINRVTTLVEKHELQVSQNQCRCLATCLERTKDSLFSKPIPICRQLLDRIRRCVTEVEKFVVKCSSKDWLVKTLSVGFSEEETKDLILELRWCLNRVQGRIANLKDQGQENQTQWTLPQLELPSDEDIHRDRQYLVNKLDDFLSRTGMDDEKRSLAKYLRGRLKILEGDSNCKPSLENLLGDINLPKPYLYEPLDRGSSGSVFSSSWLGIPSAVKILKYGDTFLNEAGILAMLSHPNTVKLYCCYQDEKHQCLVMELMDGSLYDLLCERRKSRNGRPFDLDELVEILLQIVKGMMYIHKNGFAHRDLKSMNILVTQTKGSQTSLSTGDLTVKVADFGLVKLFDPANSSPIPVTRKVGTHIWRAPEVLKGDAKIKPRRADIYSFAMICFEALTGKIPFEDCMVGTTELHRMIVEDGHRPELPEDCPVQLRTLIENCWHAKADLRPSFEEIYDTLLEFRSFLMLETNVMITQNSQTMGKPSITSSVNPFLEMCKFRLSLRTNNKEVEPQTSVAMKQGLECFPPESYAQALHELDKTIEESPDDVNALSLRCEVKFEMQDFKGSLADLDEMDVLKPNDAVTLKRRGKLKHRLEDYAGALKDLDAAMEFISDDSSLLIQRSRTREKLGNLEGALKDLNAANFVSPSNALILSLRSEMKKKLKDFKGALLDLYEVSHLFPDDASILREILAVRKRVQDEENEVEEKKKKMEEKMINIEKERKKMEEVQKKMASGSRSNPHVCKDFPCPYCYGIRFFRG